MTKLPYDWKCDGCGNKFFSILTINPDHPDDKKYLIQVRCKQCGKIQTHDVTETWTAWHDGEGKL